LALCVALVAVDAASAADPATLAVQRVLPSRVRLGEPVAGELWLRAGRRRVRGMVRDAWQPTAGAPLARAAIDIPAGERRLVRVPLLPRRRGALRSGFVVVRALGPLGLA